MRLAAGLVALGMLAPAAVGGAAEPAAPKAPAAKPPAAAAGKAAEDRNQPVTVDADHMESFQKEGLVIFTGSVVARQNGSV